MLDPCTAVVVGLPLVALGFLSLILFGRTPWTVGQVDSAQVFAAGGGVYTSASITQAHLILSGVFIVWILIFGLKLRYVPLLVVFFVLITYQGSARTTYLVGVTALVVAYLVRGGRTRPSFNAMIPIALAGLSFVSGKAWLYDLLNGNQQQAVAYSTGRQDQLLRGEGELFLNHEMLVTMTYLVPEHAPHTTLSFYGRAIYQFVRRQVWPDKPAFDLIVTYLSFNVPEI